MQAFTCLSDIMTLEQSTKSNTFARFRVLFAVNVLLVLRTARCWDPTADETIGRGLYHHPVSSPYAQIHTFGVEARAALGSHAVAPGFPDCVDLDEYCAHVHALSYDEVPTDGFRCEQEEDCLGGKCPSGGGVCVCPENQVGSNCGALLLFSQRWLWMLDHNRSDLVQRSGTWVDVGTLVIPPDASQLARDAVLYVLRRAVVSSGPKTTMWRQNSGKGTVPGGEGNTPNTQPLGLKLRLPPPAICREWFPSVGAILEYMQLLVGEWSLIQDVHRSERDQLTMDKLYAEVVFVMGCAIALQQESAGQLGESSAAMDRSTIDLTPVVADALNGAHNAVIWAVKNALRFYDAETTTRQVVFLCLRCSVSLKKRKEVCVDLLSMHDRTAVLRNGENCFFELLRLLCFVGRPGGHDMFQVDPIAQEDGHEVGCDDGRCVPDKSLLRRAVRVSLEPAVQALLQLDPSPKAVAAALPVAIINNDATLVDLLNRFSKGNSSAFSSAVSTRNELRASVLRLAAMSSSQAVPENATTCAAAEASASAHPALGASGLLPEVLLNGTSCAIDVVDIDQFSGGNKLGRAFQALRAYVKKGRPVVVRGLLAADSLDDAAALPPIMSSTEWSLAQIQQRFGTLNVTLAQIPYAENFGRVHRSGQLQELFELYPDMLRSSEVGNDGQYGKDWLAHAPDYVFDSEFLHSDQFKVPDCNRTTDSNASGNVPVVAYSWLTGDSPCIPGASSDPDPGRRYLELLAETLGPKGQLWHQWYVLQDASPAFL